MSVKFQYNKVSMQNLQKELKIRMIALPTLKSKEAYLRITIKKEQQILAERQRMLESLRCSLGSSEALFVEYPISAIRVSTVRYSWENIAGIKIPAMGKIDFTLATPTLINPMWLPWGKKTIMSLLEAQTKIDITEQRIKLLEYARKKTTQKVNLYEKVQIPEFSEAILKIKRYIEDVENLEKAAQKITKAHHNKEEESIS